MKFIDDKWLGPFLRGIAERDIDLLLLEEFHTNHCFVRWLCGSPDVTFDGAWHSVSSSYGETDLFLRVRKDGIRVGFLIENKINASEQDEQSARYQIRGKKMKEAGLIEAFSTIICAPKIYLDALPVESQYDHRLEYENIAAWFAHQPDPRSEWRRYVITQAIEQGRKGYQMIVDPARTAFHKAYWQYLRGHHPRINMAEPKERGGMSNWIVMKGTGFPRGVQLHHKFTSRMVELGFNGHSIEEILKVKSDWQDEAIYVVQKGRTASLAIEVPSIDTTADFEAQLPAVQEALKAAYRLMPYASILVPRSPEAASKRIPVPSEVIPTYLDRLEKLLAFLPVFEKPDFVFGKLGNNEPGHFPWYELSETARSFVQAAYDAECIIGFDWPKWDNSKYAQRFQNNLAAISVATPEELAKLLTCYVRADRFVDGTLVHEYDRGSLTAILARVNELVQEKTPTVSILHASHHEDQGS